MSKKLGGENKHNPFVHKLFESPQGPRTSRQNCRNIPASLPQKPRKTNNRAKTNFSIPTPFAWKTPTPLGNLPAERVSLCALFSHLKKVEICLETLDTFCWFLQFLGRGPFRWLLFRSADSLHEDQDRPMQASRDGRGPTSPFASLGHQGQQLHNEPQQTTDGASPRARLLQAKIRRKELIILEWSVSGAPVLAIQSRYRYGYSLSPCAFQVSQGIALYPLIRGEPSPRSGTGGKGASQLKLPYGGKRTRQGLIVALVSAIAV